MSVSKSVDKWAQNMVRAHPDFVPLAKAIPGTWLQAFMWMGRTSESNGAIEVYKHGITRRYLLLDHNGNAFRPTSLEPTSIWEAIESVYDGLELTSYSRETPYTTSIVAERSRALRAAGWKVVYGAPFEYTD